MPQSMGEPCGVQQQTARLTLSCILSSYRVSLVTNALAVYRYTNLGMYVLFASQQQRKENSAAPESPTHPSLRHVKQYMVCG